MSIINPREWASSKFGHYYQTCATKPSIKEVGMREFGFGGWEKKIEFRHMHFPTKNDLLSRLIQDRPLYVSCSAAYYELPAARPMARKGWLGADLIFDLDAESHSCAPFTCDECFEKIKGQAIKLVEEFLVPDFGISKSEIQLNFSGSRGYHIRVFDKNFRPLGRHERREIVDYVQGVGLSYEKFFKIVPLDISRPSLKQINGPCPEDGGYGGKFAREIVKIVSNPATARTISPKLAKAQYAKKFIEGVHAGIWSRVNIPKIDEKFRRVFDALKVKLSDQVDVNVSIDTSKILRLPDSLHGGSGLAAKTIQFSNLEKFQPTSGAIAFSNSKTEKIKALIDIPSLTWNGGKTETIKKDSFTEVPESFAVYLVCKRAAVPC